MLLRFKVDYTSLSKPTPSCVKRQRAALPMQPSLNQGADKPTQSDLHDGDGHGGSRSFHG